MEIYVSNLFKHNHDNFKKFVQMMSNRLAFGACRHGKSDSRQDYAKRAQLTLDEYNKTGNTELLIDLANYAFLEACHPLHPNAHFSTRDSHGYTTKGD